MKVAFDAKRAFNNSRGLGQYARQLILGLAELDQAPDLLLFTTGKGRSFNPPTSQKMQVERKTGLFSSLWRRRKIGSLAVKQGADIFHGLSNELPADIPPSLPSVVTIHDLIFLKHPYLYPFIDRQIYESKVKAAAARASKVIATSEQTSKDLQEMLELSADRIEVIYQSADPVFFQKHEMPKWVESLPAEFILCVGALEGRKNQLGLLKGMQSAGVDVPVIFVGTGKAYLKDLRYWAKQNGMEKMISFISGLSNTDLAILYQRALLLAYPSLYEGFGIPLAEAMASGTPILTSKGGVFEEITGPAGRLIDPYSPDSIGEGLLEVLNNKEATTNRVNAGLERAKLFTRENFALRSLHCYQGLLK